MKLYRGLKSSEYSEYTPQEEMRSRALWRRILEIRAGGDRRFPIELDQEISALNRLSRYRFQYFTDDRAIAARYAGENRGLLLEIDPPLEEVLECFHIEFQNYAKRRAQFEIVYRVCARTLAENAENWSLKFISYSTEHFREQFPPALDEPPA